MRARPSLARRVRWSARQRETIEKMARRIEYDLDYLRNWSLALDLKIILATIRLVVRDAQAY